MNISQAILGQEVVVPKYGYGRISRIINNFPNLRIGVIPYIAQYEMLFDPKNVRLPEAHHD